MIKKILTGLVVVVLIAIGGLAYLIVNLDPEELGQKLIRRVNDSGVIQMQATSFEISPFHGLYIENAHIEGALASGSLSAEIGRSMGD